MLARNQKKSFNWHPHALIKQLEQLKQLFYNLLFCCLGCLSLFMLFEKILAPLRLCVGGGVRGWPFKL
jgi:hypothetical protein